MNLTSMVLSLLIMTSAIAPLLSMQNEPAKKSLASRLFSYCFDGRHNDKIDFSLTIYASSGGPFSIFLYKWVKEAHQEDIKLWSNPNQPAKRFTMTGFLPCGALRFAILHNAAFTVLFPAYVHLCQKHHHYEWEERKKQYEREYRQKHTNKV